MCVPRGLCATPTSQLCVNFILLGKINLKTVNNYCLKMANSDDQEIMFKTIEIFLKFQW